MSSIKILSFGQFDNTKIIVYKCLDMYNKLRSFLTSHTILVMIVVTTADGLTSPSFYQMY